MCVRRCVGCDEINSAWSPDGRLSPAHRHRPEQPAPQWVGAIAAIERDDRAAVSERVPHRLPSSGGNRPARAVQAGRAGFHTPRIDASAVPPRSGTPRTCYRKPSRVVAHVTAALRRPVQSLVRKALTAPGATLPHAHGTVAFPLPPGTVGSHVPRGAEEPVAGEPVQAGTAPCGLLATCDLGSRVTDGWSASASRGTTTAVTASRPSCEVAGGHPAQDFD